MIVAGLVLVSIASVLSQDTPPPFRRIGCPAANLLAGDNYCFSPATNCLPNAIDHPDIPKNNNMYKKVRARSWWHCGMACDPTTPCKFWTYRHATRECYLLKSCCETSGDAAYQSGPVGCPN